MKLTSIVILTFFLLAIVACSDQEEIISEPTDNCEYVIPKQVENFKILEGRLGSLENAIIMSDDNHILFSGTEVINNEFHLLLMKLTLEGNIIWKWRLDDYYNSSALAIEQDEDGNIYIAGSFRATLNETSQMLVLKFNSEGSLLWQYDEEYFGTAMAHDIVILNDEIIILRRGNGPFQLIKLDPEGRKTDFMRVENLGYTLIKISDNEFLANFTLTNIDHTKNRFIQSIIDRNGETLHSNEYWRDFDYINNSIKVKDGEFISVGSSATEEFGVSQVWIIKTTETGELLWERHYGHESISEAGISIHQNVDGSFIIAGRYEQCEEYESFLMNINENGDLININYLEGEGSGYTAKLLKQDNDENILIATDNYNFYIGKLDNEGN